MKRKNAFSGKFVLRAGPQLHERLSIEASERGLSLNAYCLQKLTSITGADRWAGLGLDRHFIDRALKAFASKPIALLLFGSFARGDENNASDIDLLVVFESGLKPTRAQYRLFDNTVDTSGFQHSLNPHLVCLPESPADCGSLWFEVALDGVFLFENGRATSVFLKKLRNYIFAGRVARKWAYGQPYWVRQDGADEKRIAG